MGNKECLPLLGVLSWVFSDVDRQIEVGHVGVSISWAGYRDCEKCSTKCTGKWKKLGKSNPSSHINGLDPSLLWSCQLHVGVRITSPRCILILWPWKAVKPPFPSIIKRIAKAV